MRAVLGGSEDAGVSVSLAGIGVSLTRDIPLRVQFPGLGGKRPEVGQRVVNIRFGGYGLVLSKHGMRYRVRLDDGREVSAYIGHLRSVDQQCA